jgi:hypothetical protein
MLLTYLLSYGADPFLRSPSFNHSYFLRPYAEGKLHNLYSSPSVIRMIKSRRMRWAGHVTRVQEKRDAYRILVGKPEGNRLLQGPRRRWMNSIKIDLRGIGWDGVDWIDAAQVRDQWTALVKTVLNLRVP